MSHFDKHWKIANTHGFILFGALTGFFLLMRAVGLAQVFYLRSLNVLFVYIVLQSVISQFHKRAGVSYYEDFFDFFKIAFRTGMLGIGLFAAFVAIYLDKIDPALMDMIRESENAGGLISPVVSAFIILLEGMASVIIVAFIIIQLRKSKTVERPENEQGSLKKNSNPH